MSNTNNEFEHILDYTKIGKIAKIYNFHPIGGPYDSNSGTGSGRNKYDLNQYDFDALDGPLTIMQYE